ncbi:MAG TPA: hypothetical protein H9844_06370, partial [Candidatus Evtepia faecigallinarum]|nr:hypothetical protein [Candidatus Evtepia faecigallinarum]
NQLKNDSNENITVSVARDNAISTVGAATWSANTPNKTQVNAMQDALWDGLAETETFGFKVDKVFAYSNGKLTITTASITENIKTWVNTNWGGTSVPVAVMLNNGFTAKETDANWNGAALIWIDLANPASSYTLELVGGGSVTLNVNTT